MLSVSDRLRTVTHPLVASMRMKRDFSNRKHHAEDVLVIETVFSKENADHEEFDSYLIELLADLSDLKRKAERCVGSFDRVDIHLH